MHIAVYTIVTMFAANVLIDLVFNINMLRNRWNSRRFWKDGFWN